MRPAFLAVGAVLALLLVPVLFLVALPFEPSPRCAAAPKLTLRASGESIGLRPSLTEPAP